MTDWLKYTRWLESRLPIYHDLLRAGASDEAIDALETKTGAALPDQFRELYRINDGDDKRAKGRILGSFLGFEFLSLAGIAAEWDSWKAGYGKDPVDSMESSPEGHIKRLDANPGWIPLFADNGGNYIGLDLDPGPKGRIGQVINFGRDEWKKFVIAEDLAGFLGFIVAEMENGVLDASIVQEDEEEFSYGLSRQSHLIDDLKSILVS